MDKFSPKWRNQLFIGQFPDEFPADASGAPLADHIAKLFGMSFDTSLVPKDANGQPSIRNLGSQAGDAGDARYNYDAYIIASSSAGIRRSRASPT